MKEAWVRDPRLEAARHQFRGIKNIFIVLSSKGGVGKSTVSIMLALSLRERGLRVGLLDVDLSNPTLHTFFADPWRELREEMGIVPPEVATGIRLSSPALFTRGAPVPSIGKGPVDAVLELLAISNWTDTEALVVDTSPGLRDEHILLIKVLDAIVPDAKRVVVVVTTPSLVAIRNAMAGLDYILSFAKGFRLVAVLNKATTDRPLPKEVLRTECVIVVPRDSMLEEKSPTLDEVLKSSAFSTFMRQVKTLSSCFG